ncbi:MAG: translation initiation factor IF-2 [Desulfosudaceae bacterium]
MAKIRIYELARALNMTNKVLLEKLKQMGLEVKSHMSSLDKDTADKVRQEVFGAQSTQADVIEQKRVGSTIIRKRRQKTRPAETTPEEAPEGTGETAPEQETTTAAPSREAEELTEPADEEAASLAPESAESDKSAESDEMAEATETTAESVPDQEKETQEAAEQEAVTTEPDATASTTADETEATAEAKEPDSSEPASEAKKKKAKTKKQEAARIIKFPEKPAVTTEPRKTVSKPSAKTEPTAPPTQEDKDQKPSKKARKKRKKTEETTTDEARVEKKKSSFKRREVVEGAALYDSRPRGRNRKKGKGKTRVPGSEKTQITTPKAIKRRIKIDESITVAELAKRMGIKASEIISKLMGLGVMATVNQAIDYDTAALVATEFEYEVERASLAEEEILNTASEDAPETLQHRAPVVTIMGHVDHGKTSLLDVIRKSHIADGEAGGITQHIGAYKVATDKGAVVFLDTPGHEAFTSMRSRGAQATDIVVLVVAADDGVMPQTVEAINHSRAANVPILVAVNKIDKDNADLERVKRELAEHDLISEEWGGETIFVNVSAKQQIGINDLLDMIILQSEMLELKANPDKFAKGLVIESKVDPGRGPVATVLIQEGTLKVGEAVVCGIYHGKIRAMLNDIGAMIDLAGPSTPVEILGLGGVVNAGDEFIALQDEKNARMVSENRYQKQRTKDLARSTKVSLENFFEQMQAGDVSHLNIIIKTDVNGSCEAIEDALKKISAEDVAIDIIHAGAGTITESDVALASASNAIILGFNVRASSKVKTVASEEHVDIRYYNVIYDLIEDVKEAVTGLMSPKYEERVLGRAEVRELFVIPKKGTIAGCLVVEGTITRNRKIRVIRDGVVIYEGLVGSLRRFKEDAREVKNGFECGIGVDNFNDLKVNDVLECFYYEEIQPVLA